MQALHAKSAAAATADRGWSICACSSPRPFAAAAVEEPARPSCADTECPMVLDWASTTLILDLELTADEVRVWLWVLWGNASGKREGLVFTSPPTCPHPGT
jgi:hypothetical protein